MKILKSDNPAYQAVVTDSLRKKLIQVNNVTVKDVIASTNIDYAFLRRGDCFHLKRGC